ncbi:MAG: MFS transporter [Woeseia sp.]|nr:MFS transporter [Woeseia sp.]MBT8097198.1 MFS transporter [Woeseia sp.]
MNDLRARIDAHRVTPLQYAVIALCFLLNVLDGMDVLVIAFAAPALAAEWGIGPESLGIVFGMGTFGMVAGAMLLAPLGDRLGRRTLILVSVAAVGISVALTALVTSVAQLLVVRFISGMGIGVLLASSATVAAEYAPDRKRNLVVGFVMAGYTIGAFGSGLIAAQVIPVYGWPTMFVIAGVASLATLPFLIWLLPESLDFLVRVRPRQALPKINRILQRMDMAPLERLPALEAVETPANVPALLHRERRGSTLMLWAAFFMSFAALYFLLSWIPKLAAATGIALELAIYAGAVFNLGAFFGICLQGWLSLTFGLQRTIAAFMFAAAALMLAFGFVTHPWYVLVMFGLIGFTVQGGFVGLYAVAARLYPAELRNTGIGWAIGLGRFGAVVGPIAAGYLIAAGLGLVGNFVVFALPMLLAGVLTLLIRAEQLRI